MSVLDRAALQDSPLADLHAIASELSIDGYRRLRRPELIDAILARQGGEPEASEAAPAETEDQEPEQEPAQARRRRGRRGGRSRSGQEEAPAEAADAEKPGEAVPAEDEVVEGLVELLPNGSGFVRVQPPEQSENDIYISAAQVRRCELVSGDRVTGPRRAPRRSERFASLVRIDTVNGQPAEELAGSIRFDDLPAAFPSDPLELRTDDPVVREVAELAPIGRGSRVTISGPARSGKTQLLRRLAGALVGRDELQLSLALAGVRPEELGQWDSIEPAVALSFAASADAQGHAVELVVDQARRIASRGGNAIVLIDTLDGLHRQAARKVLAAARNIVDGGSLTLIATAAVPLGGETTVIALDRMAAGSDVPAVDRELSGTIHAERLVDVKRD
jgi:transcription termination factor Rho